MNELQSPEYLAEKEKWDAERDRLLAARDANWNAPVPEPLRYVTDRIKTAEWQKQVAETNLWKKSPEGLADTERRNDEREAEKLENERLARVPLILMPERVGHVQKGQEEPIFVLQLAATCRERGSGLGSTPVRNLLPVPEGHMDKFVLTPQEFVVEIEDDTVIWDAIEWIDGQTTIVAWSLTQCIGRRVGRPKIMVSGSIHRYSFSFCDIHSAALFKMFYG